MQILDKIKIQGILSIWKVFPDGNKELAFHEENLITLAAKQELLSYIYSSTTTSAINGLKVGTGGTIDPQGLFPKQEDQNWTTLNATVTTVGTGGLISVGQSVDSTVPKVTFLADLDQSTGNGNLISEAGLFKSNGGMFNVKTFPAIPKTSEFSLHFEWVIKLA